MQALWAADMYLAAAENGVTNVDWWDSFANRGTAIITGTQGTANSQTVPPYSLTTVHLRPGSGQSPSSLPPSSVPPSSRPPSSPPPATHACTAVYRTVNSWQGGFQGEVTVTAGSSPVNGWTTTWTLANGQTISQLWNGTLSTSGSTATVRNVSWNRSLGAGASTTFGFTGTGPASTPTVTCTGP